MAETSIRKLRKLLKPIEIIDRCPAKNLYRVENFYLLDLSADKLCGI